MAPIDIVQAQAEVASNEERVIVAEAAIKRAQDNLRALILDPATPDFWTTTFEPSDAAPFAGAGDRHRRRRAERARQAHGPALGEEQPRAQRHQHPVPPQPDSAGRQRAGDLRRGRRRRRAASGEKPVRRRVHRLDHLADRARLSARCSATCSAAPSRSGPSACRSATRSARARRTRTWRARGSNTSRRRRS